MITLIVPVRDWPAERVRNCVSSFSVISRSILAEILVVDFGSRSPVDGPRYGDPVQIIRVEADTWSLAEAINVGVVSARSEIIVKTDADILLAPESVPAFEARVRELSSATDFGLSLSPAIDLPAGVGADEAWDGLREGRDPGGTLRPRWGQGGLTMFRRKSWESIGGYDSRLTGWGNEDNDFAERLRHAGHRIDWTAPDQIKIYHVAHPATYAAPIVAAQRRKNQSIIARDKSVFRRMVFRHSRGLNLKTPAIVNRMPPHVTLAVATMARPGRDRMIVEALSSFRKQIDGDFEAVVVDNGSSDDEHQLLRKRLGALRGLPPIRIERTATASIPAARNMITDLARGRYICIVDDDDIALGNRLSDHLACFTEDGSIHGSHGGWVDFDETTGQIERNPGRPRRLSTMLLGRGKITAHPASLYRTDVLRAVRYDESISLGSDMDLALRMAALGLKIAHTHSFVALRRFHAANVTLTGATQQAMGGVRARDRLWAALNHRHAAYLRDEGKAGDADEFCRNHLTLEEIVRLMPDYAGEWRLTLPVAALQDPLGDLAQQAERLEALINLAGGEFTTLRPGIDQPMMFVSDAIKGAQKALKAADAVDAIVGERPGFVSSVQYEADRRVPFDWRGLFVDSDQTLLRSAPFRHAEQVLEVLTRIEGTSLLRSSIRVVADTDDTGPTYCLISGPHDSAEHVRTTMAALKRLTRTPFTYFGPNGEGNALLLGDKVH